MSPCIDPEQFQRLLAEQLSAPERQALDDHVDRCTRCQATLTQLLDDSLDDTKVDWQLLRRVPGELTPGPAEGFLKQLQSNPPPSTPGPASGSESAAIQFPEPPTARGPLGKLGPYHIISELGRGAFALVFKAHDELLDCLVALKVLKPELALSASDRARFENEARKAAAVRHDHIVTVHQVGGTPGFVLPYFVMEYLDGEALSDRLRRLGPIEPKEAAEIVRQVALGLVAAHGQGLIHRDIKPSNIMLERHSGRAKITDFGLAKRLDVDLGQTQSGAIIGTPSYMSPEQAAGKTKEIGPAADVYSLGASLYEMLTGRPPFLGVTLMDTLQQVVAEEPVPPRRLQPKVPRDLDTICLKALAKEPARRYAAAEALAEDLRRFLAGEPIRGRPSSVWERGMKWARRRPAVAALVAVSVLAVLGVALGGLWHNARLEAALGKTEEQRRRAETNFEKARAAVEQMLTEVAEKHLKGVPEMDLVREALLRKALAFYQEFLLEKGNDPGVRQETAWAYRRVADIHEMLGHHDEAANAYRQALALQDQLVAEFPEEPKYRDHQAIIHDHWSKLHYSAGRLKEAEAAQRTALAILDGLVRECPGVSLYQEHLATSHGHLGLFCTDSARGDEAEAAYRQAIRLWNDLADKEPAEARYRYRLASAHHNLGHLYHRIGRAQQVEDSYKQCIRIMKVLAAEHADVTEYQALLARSHEGMAWWYWETSKLDQAKEAIEEAVRISERFARPHPFILEYQCQLAEDYIQLGLVMADMEKTAEAHQAYQSALVILEPMPKVANYQTALARAYWGLGWLYQSTEQTDKADATYQKALGLFKQLLAEQKNVPDHRNRLAHVYHELGMLYGKMKEPTKAVAAYKEAVALREPLTAEYPKALRYQDDLAQTYTNLYVVYDNAKESDEAEVWYQKAVAVRLACAAARARLGEHARAKAVVDELAKDNSLTGATLYRMACVCSLCVSARQQTTGTPADGDEFAAQYAASAMRWLTQAGRAGHFRTADHLDQLRKDNDLDPLRSRDDFRNLLAELEKKANTKIR